MLIVCPMEDKLHDFGEIMTTLIELISKLNVKLEGLNLNIESALELSRALEERLGGLNEELEDRSQD